MEDIGSGALGLGTDHICTVRSCRGVRWVGGACSACPWAWAIRSDAPSGRPDANASANVIGFGSNPNVYPSMTGDRPLLSYPAAVAKAGKPDQFMIDATQLTHRAASPTRIERLRAS